MQSIEMQINMDIYHIRDNYGKPSDVSVKPGLRVSNMLVK